jgi:hypothetical protein
MVRRTLQHRPPVSPNFRWAAILFAYLGTPRNGEFISVSSVAAAWPLAERAHQGETHAAHWGANARADDLMDDAFLQGLHESGWIGSQYRMDHRFGCTSHRPECSFLGLTKRLTHYVGTVTINMR